jgi:hypothetical protein
MEHAFTTEAGNAGVWITVEDQVYCRWRWDQSSRNLIVEARDVTRSWTTPELDQSGESGIELDLPETAKDIAHLIERQLRAAS